MRRKYRSSLYTESSLFIPLGGSGGGGGDNGPGAHLIYRQLLEQHRLHRARPRLDPRLPLAVNDREEAGKEGTC